MMYDVWCMMSDVWCLMYDVWCKREDVRCVRGDKRYHKKDSTVTITCQLSTDMNAACALTSPSFYHPSSYALWIIALQKFNKNGSSSLLLIKENQENPSSSVLALRASVVVHGFVPVNKFPHKPWHPHTLLRNIRQLPRKNTVSLRSTKKAAHCG